MVVLIRLPYIGLKLDLVIVMKVVWDVERKMLLKFGSHWRLPEFGCQPPAPPLTGSFSCFRVRYNERSLMKYSLKFLEEFW